MHWDQISNIDGLKPYFESKVTIHAGCRDDDEYLSEVRQTIGPTLPASSIKNEGAEKVASEVLAIMKGVDGYWLHLDVDILDPNVMPAVDSPSPGGLEPKQLIELLGHLAPRAIGAELTIFDPELDPTGTYARLVAQIVLEGFQNLGEGKARLYRKHS